MPEGAPSGPAAHRESAATGQPEDQAAPSSGRLPQPDAAPKPVEIGGPKGPEPTRYGDWERNGRCSDF